MAGVVTCLLRVGNSVKKYKIVKLDRDKVTIGTNPEDTYVISSNMISQCHAVIEHQGDDTWSITDNKSLNGTFVNGQQLKPFAARTLWEGDLVQFGVSPSPDAAAEFVYKFYSSLEVPREKRCSKKLKLDSSACEDNENLNASDSFEFEDCERKRKKACVKQSDDSKLSDSRMPDTLNNSLRQLMEESHKKQVEKEAEYLARLAEMERLLKEKEEHEIQVKKELEQERKEKEHQAKEMEELRMKEQTIFLEMQEKQEQLEKERNELNMKIQAELEASIKERETALIAQLAGQREMLLLEKRQVEESLQKEMEKAEEEKNKELELLNQKEKLEKLLQMKDMEQKLLENQLNETKQENATAKIQVLKAREDILSNFVELMETELQCSICNELIVKATSLNCSHVFCKLCISQWRKVKKVCPNCRCPITSQLQAIALDSYIDKMVEQLNDEMKQKRAVFVEQRKAEQVKYDASEAGPSCEMAAGAIPNTDGAGASSGTGNRRAHGSSRRAQGSSRTSITIGPGGSVTIGSGGGVRIGPGGSVTVGGIRITENGSIIINGNEIIRGGSNGHSSNRRSHNH